MTPALQQLPTQEDRRTKRDRVRGNDGGGEEDRRTKKDKVRGKDWCGQTRRCSGDTSRFVGSDIPTRCMDGHWALGSRSFIVSFHGIGLNRYTILGLTEEVGAILVIMQYTKFLDECIQWFRALMH